MKKIKILTAAVCMFLCLAAAPHKVSAVPSIQGTVSNLGKVQGLKAGVCTTRSINIHWNLMTGAHGYEIYRATARNGKYTLLKAVPSTSQAFMNTTVAAGKEYFYKVRAFVATRTGRSYGKFSKILRANTKPLSLRKGRIRGNVNVRKYAGTNYARVFGLVRGTKVTILCETCDRSGAKWYRIQVKINGKKYRGYVRGDLIV